MYCRMCTNEFTAKRADAKYCGDSCRIKYGRTFPEGQPAHAVKCDKGTPGAVWRSYQTHIGEGGYWVIPGRHMVVDIETSCLDPKHTNMEMAV